MIRILFYSFIFLIPTIAISFVHTRTSDGKIIRWPSNTKINLNINTGSVTDFSVASFATIFNQSLLQFTSNSKLEFNTNFGNMDDSAGQSNVSFTNRPYMSSGVLGLTSLSYSGETGIISEGDILLNDSYTFSTSSSFTAPFYYIGDVLSHELGHLVGLSHNESYGSTMLYTVFKGQSTLDYDDLSGLTALYPKSSKGTILGSIVAGKSPIGIFGAKVSAISAKLGKVVASTLSNDDGTFSLQGLDLNDFYYIYVSPFKNVTTLPEYYSSIQTNICSGSSFKGAFFNKCGDSYKDIPQAINLTSTKTSINVGKITVQCNYNSTADYLNQKNAISRDSRSLFLSTTNNGGSKTGVFFNYEKLGPTDVTYKDNFAIDLTNVSSPSGKYLDLKFISHSLFSNLAVSIYVTRGTGGSAVSYSSIYSSASPIYDSDNIETLNRTFQVPLSSTSSENTFTVSLVGILSSAQNSSSTFLPTSTNLVEDQSFYLLIGGIIGSDSTYYGQQESVILDNTTCAQGTVNYKTSAYITKKDTSSLLEKSSTDNSLGVSCGTVNDESGSGGNGPMQMFNLIIGFLFMFSIRFLKKILVS